MNFQIVPSKVAWTLMAALDNSGDHDQLGTNVFDLNVTRESGLEIVICKLFVLSIIPLLLIQMDFQVNKF